MSKPPKSTKKRKTVAPPKNVGGRPPNLPIRPAVIRAKREELRLSRGQVEARMRALGVNVTGSTIYLWEKGKHSPSDESLAALCAVLGLKTSEILVESKAKASA